MLGSLRGLLAGCCYLILAVPALAQMPGGGPPAVGVIVVEPKEVAETTEFNGRVEATDRVNLVARVSAYLEEQLFRDGADVRWLRRRGFGRVPVNTPDADCAPALLA